MILFTLIILALIAVLLIFFVVRWVRWLAIVQQKEYRVDRLITFLQSAEGRQDILRLLPSKSDFSRTGMKRPVRTARVLVVAVISLFLILCGSFGIVSSGVVFWLFWLSVLYVVLPLIVITSCLPTAFYSEFATLRALSAAKRKIQKGKPVVIGIGGSYGKTSTKHLLHHVLSQKFSVFVTPKSHNTKYSVAQSILRGYTDQQVALLEYGAYTIGEIRYLTQWFPVDIAVETGFTLQHVGLFGSAEKSMIAESELIAALPKNGTAFCNGADGGAVHICELGKKENKVEVIHYSGDSSQVKLENVWLDDHGQLVIVWDNKVIHTQLLGLHYAINIQGVIAVAKCLGLRPDEIAYGLESFLPNALFVQSRTLGSGTVVIDDGGTSNPKGFMAAMELVSHLKQTHKILFTSGIVDLAEESAKVHDELAQRAKKLFEAVVYLGVEGQTEFKNVFGEQCFTEREQLEKLLSAANADTLLLIEGRMPKWLKV